MAQIEPLGVAPHVAQLVRKWLIEWADRNGYNIYADGLVVRTTLSSRHQKAANLAVARNVARLQSTADAQRKRGQERQLLQAGFLAMDPRNGHIRAWVGSPDFAQAQFDHVVQARRQPGSTFKPFICHNAPLARGPCSPGMTDYGKRFRSPTRNTPQPLPFRGTDAKEFPILPLGKRLAITSV
jgi:membrane carboxypeptidase/penicillin-binding protein